MKQIYKKNAIMESIIFKSILFGIYICGQIRASKTMKKSMPYILDRWSSYEDRELSQIIQWQS
jgi:hypothetical protein